MSNSPLAQTTGEAEARWLVPVSKDSIMHHSARNLCGSFLDSSSGHHPTAIKVWTLNGHICKSATPLSSLLTCPTSLVASPTLLLGSMVPCGAQLAPPPSGAGTTEHQGRCKPHGIGVRTLSFAGAAVLLVCLSLSCCQSSSAATWAAGVVHGSQYHHSKGNRH